MTYLSRKRLFVFGLVALAFFSALYIFLSAAPEPRPQERVVVIYLRGSIEEAGATGFTSTITPRDVARQLEKAAEDETIKAAVLRVNSPGGAVAASQQIAGLIRDFTKPVVVSMGDMAASGGYYISSAADAIVAHPGTMTGSIGVIMMNVNPEGLYEKLGLEMEIIKSGEHKDMFHRGLHAEERQLLQNLSDEAYAQFIGDVAEGTGLEEARVEELATGEIFIGSRAHQLGLVDELGGVDEAVQMAGELAGLEEPQKYEFPPPSVLEQFFHLAFQLPELLRKGWLPSELFLLEEVKQGFFPQLRYEIR